jgi:formiminoglutamase
VAPPEGLLRRPDDPRLAEVAEFWHGPSPQLWPGRAVLIGFPQDEGVRRNQGRPGAAAAPHEIRRWLYRLTPWDCQVDVNLAKHPPLDLGNIRIEGSLEDTQEALAEVIAAVLGSGAIPIVLGGGHETAYGHYLGYVKAQRRVGIINIDAHLDVRPTLQGLGHSGSPFRQALEHPSQPLLGRRYVCVGAQPHNVSREHLSFVRQRDVIVHWNKKASEYLYDLLQDDLERLTEDGCSVYLTLDADAVRAADVPGVSSPNPTGLSGQEVLDCVREAGWSPEVSSFDLVEINPTYDLDGRSARWAALVIWNFLIGVANRPGKRSAS